MKKCEQRFNHHLTRLEQIVDNELEALKEERGPITEKRRDDLQNQKEHFREVRVMREGGDYKKS